MNGGGPVLLSGEPPPEIRDGEPASASLSSSPRARRLRAIPLPSLWLVETASAASLKRDTSSSKTAA